MLNTTVTFYNQNGGAAKKRLTTKGLKTKGSGKKTIKGLTNPAVKETQDLAKKIADNEKIIEDLPENIKDFQKKYKDCKELLAKNLHDITINEQQQIKENTDIIQKNKDELLNTYNKIKADIKLSEQEEYNKYNSDKLIAKNDAIAKIQKEYDDKFNLKKALLPTELNYEQQKKDLEKSIIEKLQADKTNIETERNKITTELITNAYNNYKSVPTEYTKSVLALVCPKNSTNDLCKKVKDIPNIYDTVENIGCYYYNWTDNKTASPYYNNSAGPQKPRITPQLCASICYDNNPLHNYSGIAPSNMCYCGTESDFMNTKSKKSENEPTKCNIPCENAVNHICGGKSPAPWYDAYLSIYKYTKNK